MLLLLFWRSWKEMDFWASKMWYWKLCVIVWITLWCNVDNYIKLLCLLCFETWITLLCVRVVRTVLLFCLRVADSKVSLWYGHICDCIVFGILHVVTTLGMFFGVNLGWATTLWVKMWCFLGFGDTFDFFECIRETDTTERFLSLAERQMFVYQRQIYQVGSLQV